MTLLKVETSGSGLTFRDLDERIDTLELDGVTVGDPEFGGVGTADDSVSVQAALDAGAGKTVRVTGIHYVTDVRPATGTRLIGPGKLIQKANSAIGACAILIGTGVTDVTIDGVEIDGNKANQTDQRAIHGIRIAGQRVVVKDSYIHDCEYNGVSMQEGAAHVQILGNRITDVGTPAPGTGGWGHGVNGEAASGIRGVIVEGNYIARSGQHGVRGGDDCFFWTVQGNHFDTIGHDCFAAYNDTNIGLSFIGNLVENPDVAGCHIGGTNIVVSANTMRAVGGVGILLGSIPNNDPVPSNGATVTGNRIYQTEDVAIELRNYSQASITGNEIDNTTASSAADQGILVTGTYGATPAPILDIAVTGNIVRRATGSGVQISRATNVTCSGNEIVACGSRGLRLVDVAQLAISGNTITGNALDGVFSDGTLPSDVTVSGNAITSNGGYAIRHGGGDHFTIVGNNLRSNTTAALLLTGTNNIVERNKLDVAPLTANSTNASFTYTPFVSAPEIVYTAVKTNNRNCTLATTNAQTGMRFRLVNKSTGAFTVDFGTGLKTVANAAWAEAVFNGSAWELSAQGSL